jgi:hypothetical protein
MSMNVSMDAPLVERMIAAYPDLSGLREQLRYGHRIEVPVSRLSVDALRFLAGIYAESGPVLAQRGALLSTLADALDGDGQRFEAGQLEQLVPALARHLARNALRGWLFTANATTRPLPWVVTRLDYTPANNEETGKVFIELKANVKASIATQVIRIYGSDIENRTVAEVLAEKGFVKETAALVAAADVTTERYVEWRSRYGAQFSGDGTGFHAEDPTATHRDTDWSRKDSVVLSAGGGRARLVNDEGILPPRSLLLDAPGDILGPYLRKAAKSNRYEAEDEVDASRAEMPEGLFSQLPVHPFMLMFHLDLHHHVWVHVDDIEPWSYQPGLKAKLVLPPAQTDLIDILTAEMDVLMDDIVAGKGGGTTVLCAGPPGVGKTLTAEVYAEIIGRPLYRVHSGQLGLNVAQMENALKNVLVRAQRWGAVMLIDEADVYIKRREDDMTMNAVVGVFLRVLEYFNGLLFLTTNRIDDIDEAIVSRCIALIRYDAPDLPARIRIWQVMAAQFGLSIDEALCTELARRYPEASGRDIKGLAKLAAKYCQHKLSAPTLDVFRRCAVFRGMNEGPEYRNEAAPHSPPH